MSKFARDLKIGQYFEDKLLSHVKYISYDRPDGYFPDYDFKFYKKSGKTTTYEVKADFYIPLTGNIAIEYECNNRPSGISLSTAKYWAIFAYNGTNYTLYKIPKKILIHSIEKQKYFKKAVGGDNNASRLYLFKKELFNEYIIYNDL